MLRLLAGCSVLALCATLLAPATTLAAQPVVPPKAKKEVVHAKAQPPKAKPTSRKPEPPSTTKVASRKQERPAPTRSANKPQKQPVTTPTSQKKPPARAIPAVAGKQRGAGRSARMAGGDRVVSARAPAKQPTVRADIPLPSAIYGRPSGYVLDSGVSTNCVRFVQRNSDFDLRGKAYTWWSDAQGRYPRTHRPQAGSVLVFRSTGKMPMGHVALVRRVVDSRHILIDHSNWSGGRGGRIDLGVQVADVSPNNDWSEVRVWYGPLRELGSRVYPVYGFILPETPTRQFVAERPLLTPPTHAPAASQRLVVAADDSFDAPIYE